MTRGRYEAGALMSVLASSLRASTHDPPRSHGLAGMGTVLSRPIVVMGTVPPHGQALGLVFVIIIFGVSFSVGYHHCGVLGLFLLCSSLSSSSTL